MLENEFSSNVIVLHLLIFMDKIQIRISEHWFYIVAIHFTNTTNSGFIVTKIPSDALNHFSWDSGFCCSGTP